MQLLSEFFTGILIGYLAFTNALADGLLALTEGGGGDDIENNLVLPSLSGAFSGDIADILLTSRDYQQAATIAARDAVQTTSDDPLESVVNIFCTFTTPDYVRTTTGTGFFVDGDGVILTNAHVAQFFLLEQTDRFGVTDCIIRDGNPAAPEYRAELLYISPTWVRENAAEMQKSQPVGTGERDYALLYVDRSIDSDPLPASFAALPFDTSLLTTGAREAEVIAAGYPATELIRNGANTPLIPKKADTTISELYTFSSNYADIFSIRGSDVGAQGASGGPVLGSNGNVIGLITTRGDDTIDGAGSLRAITLSYVDRTITEETGYGLAANVGGNLKERSEIFNQVLSPFLLALLEAEVAG